MTMLIILSINLLFYKMKKPVLFIVFYVLQLIYMFASFSYFLYFHSYLHILQSIMLIGEGLGAFKASAAPKNLDLLILLIDLPVFIYMLFAYGKTVKKLKDHKLRNNIIIIACILILSLTEGWHYLHNFSLFQLINSSATSESLVVERYGTMVNNLSDILLFSNELPLINTFKYGKEISSTNNKKPAQNFVIIQVESMDSNIINTKYKGKYIMPYLQSLTQESVYFPYTLSYHKGGATSDTEFSIINSIDPLDSFPAIKLNSYFYPNSFLKRLADQSYSLLAFHGNVGNYFNRSLAFPKMGFQEFNDMLKMKLKNEIWGAPDHKVFNYALPRIKSASSPFLSYIITMTSHGPFDNAEHFYNNSDYADIKDTMIKRYFNSMSYVDKSLHDFILSVKSDSKNLNILIWGDHTPNLGNELYKQASFVFENKYFEFVPLIILTPDKKIYKETKKVASFLDISPTILNASGVPYEIKSEGIDLLQVPSDNNTIPFKGSNYDRELLYSKIVEGN